MALHRRVCGLRTYAVTLGCVPFASVKGLGLFGGEGDFFFPGKIIVIASWGKHSFFLSLYGSFATFFRFTAFASLKIGSLSSSDLFTVLNEKEKLKKGRQKVLEHLMKANLPLITSSF